MLNIVFVQIHNVAWKWCDMSKRCIRFVKSSPNVGRRMLMVGVSFVMRVVKWLIIWRERMSYNIALDSFVTEKNNYYGKNQTKYSFPNGYGASVISGEGIRQFEIAVLDGEELCYTTEITDDVIAGLSVEGVYKVLDKIKNLC
jgi:hypothetical protein